MTLFDTYQVYSEEREMETEIRSFLRFGFLF